MTLRVLHIIDQHKIGGPGKTIVNSARFSDKQRFEIHVATFLPGGNLNTELSREICSKNIPHLFLIDVPGINIENFNRLREYIRRCKISILHCHGYKSEVYAYMLKLCCRSLIFVATYHGWITNDRSQKVIVKITQLFSFLFDGIITVAYDILQKLPKITKAWTICRVIHNAIVLEDYIVSGSRQAVRNQYGIRDDEFVIGVIGRLSPEKGCIEAIDALSNLKRISIKARLMIIGDGPLKHDLVQYARDQKIDGQIVFTGHVHPVHPLYMALDLVISPSYSEGISNVILEGMAFRKPIIATAVGGTPEIITNNINGILIPPRDSSALSDAIAVFIKDLKVKHRLVESGYETIINHFDFKQHQQKVENFYEDIIDFKNRKIFRKNNNII